MPITSNTIPAPPNWAVERALSELGISDDVEAGRLMARAAEIVAAALAPPTVPWAERVIIETPEQPGDVPTARACRIFHTRPEVGIYALYAYRDGQWSEHLLELATVEDSPSLTVEQARTLAAAIVRAADLLAQIQAGGQDR